MRFLVWRLSADRISSWRSWRAEQRGRGRLALELAAIAGGALLASLLLVAAAIAVVAAL